MGPRKLLKYNISQQEYTSLRSVVLERKLNGVTVLNAGNTIVLWNGIPISPGVSLTLGGNEGEVYIGRVDLSFALPSPVPGTPSNSAWVIQKFYVDDNVIL
jgi:hypothetical protein